MKPKVSIIVPVYNVEDYINRCIDSLKKQSLEDIEIILIDDGSTDKSGIICDEIAKNEERVIVIHQDNHGVSSARNVGINIASGEFIGFVDPDDWCEENMYKIMYEAIIENNCDMVICGFVIHENENADIYIPYENEIVDGKTAFSYCIKGIGLGCFTSVWNKLFKKELFNSFRFNEKYVIGEDEVLLSQISSSISRTKLISQPLYHWNMRKNSALGFGEDYFQKWQLALEAKCEVLNNLDEFDMEEYKASIYNTMFNPVWKLYCYNTSDDYKILYNNIIPYKSSFYESINYSRKKKIRYSIIEKAIENNMPKSMIIILGKLTTARVKNKLI